MDSNENNASSSKQALTDLDELLESSGGNDTVFSGTPTIARVIEHMPVGLPLLIPLRRTARPHHEKAARYFDDAMLYLYDGEWKRAANALSVAQQLVPNTDFVVLRGLIHLEQVKWLVERDRLQEAATEFKSVEELIPNHEATLEMRQHLVGLSQDFKAEQDRVKQLQKDEAAERRRLIQEQQQDATKRLRDQIKQKHQEENNQRRKEEQKKKDDLLEQQRREKEARIKIEAEKKRQQEQNAPVKAAALLYEKAKEAREQNDWQQIVILLEQACRLDPNNDVYLSHLESAKKTKAGIHYARANECLTNLLFKEAEDEVKIALALVPKEPAVLNLKAIIDGHWLQVARNEGEFLETAKAHLSNGSVEQARKIYLDILEKSPGNLSARNGLADCRRREVKRKLRTPSRLLYLQWFLVNGFAMVILFGMMNEMINVVGGENWILIPISVVILLLLCGPYLKGRALSTLKDSAVFRVPVYELIYCSLIYFPFGWLGIFWAKVLKWYDPTVIEVFDDQVQFRAQSPFSI